MAPARERRWWTTQEDKILKDAVQEQLSKGSHALNWNEIAFSLSGRTNKDCRKRWSKVQVDIQKGVWTWEEDQRLHHAVQQVGFKWSRVATMVQRRNADQCAKRWQQRLRPGLKHTSWTPEEDERLLAAIRTYDHNWKQISVSEFPNRSTHDIRNRSLLLGRRSRVAGARGSIPTQSPTLTQHEEQSILPSESRSNEYIRADSSECDFIDAQNMLFDPEFGAASSSCSEFQRTNELPITSNSTHAGLDQWWVGSTSDIHNDQGGIISGTDWVPWSSNFEQSPSIVSASEGLWGEEGFPDQSCFFDPQPSGVDLYEFSGRCGGTGDMEYAGGDVDGSIPIQQSESSLGKERKGSVTLTLDQVDPTVAHEIMGSMLKHSAGLKVRYIFNGE